MSEAKKKKPFSQHIRQVFITGLIILLPLVVTFYMLQFIFELLTTDILPLLMKLADTNEMIVSPYVMQFIALIIVIALVFTVGLITRVYLGNKLIKFIDYIMSKIPIAKTIYNGTKQVIDSFSATSSTTFSKVVMVEYPRRDMWMLAFIVKDTDKYMTDCSIPECDCYNLFIPTAPNPTSGYVAIVAKDDVKEIDISVEDGIKFVLSVGLVAVKPGNAERVIKKALENVS